MRLRLIISYDGGNYAGWQRQINALSVQEVLETAIARLCGVRTVTTSAGRTDAGVHALGQVVHFDTQSNIPPEKWCFALNTQLPEDIRVLRSEAVAPDFHARYHAKGKRYAYTIHNATHALAMGRQYAWHVSGPLDDALMQETAHAIVGRHDFARFVAAGGGTKTTVRTMHSATVQRQGTCVTFAIEGEGFLYHMVRILAGTLCEVGRGKLAPDTIARALCTGEPPPRLGSTAPAHGLCLQEVWY